MKKTLSLAFLAIAFFAASAANAAVGTLSPKPKPQTCNSSTCPIHKKKEETKPKSSYTPKYIVSSIYVDGRYLFISVAIPDDDHLLK